MRVSLAMKIEYRADERSRAVIGSLGRTEDIRFSPNGRRLAIAAFNDSRIAIFTVEIGRAGGVLEVQLTDGIKISSPALRYPHGLDFLDDATLAVASRDGGIAIFRVPPSHTGNADLSPIQVLGNESGSLISTPGSVSIVCREGDLCELLVCNTYVDTVSRHLVDRNAGCSILESEVLLRKWIDLPDGVCTSRDGRWIAVSNHNTHGVLLYERSAPLNESSSPVGVLRGATYPHGLRFSANGRYLLLADAGAPFVHAYACGSEGWHGTRTPAASIRVMDEHVFRSARHSPKEGGPKGVDLDPSMTVLATTSEGQPLQFLDAEAVLATVPLPSSAVEVEYELAVLDAAAKIKAHARHAGAKAAAAATRAAEAGARATAAEQRARKLESMVAHHERRAEKFKAKAARHKAKAARAKAKAGLVIGGRPRRITAPLSWLFYALRRSN
jgi:hypothetical protein